MNPNQAIALHKWNRAVRAFNHYFSGAKPNKQANRLVNADMNDAAWDWCDRSLDGIRPVSPMATAHGK